MTDPKELRGSHFQLGSTSQKNQFTSTMKMNFKPQQEVESRQNVGDKLNLRGSHFQLGDNQTKYVTTQKTHFQGEQIVNPVTLNQEQKNDLRKNHFVLGHQDGQMVTANRAFHNAKPVQPNIQNEQDEQKAKMRAHHHNFAESDHKMMQTHYNQQYSKPEMTYQKQENNMDRVLRSSNIVFGKEKLPMVTIQQEDYAKKQTGAQPPTKPAFQSSHFALGDAKRDFTTINQEYLIPQKMEQNPFAEENRQNLRATHFILGKEGQPYKSETQSNYRPYSQDPVYMHSHTKFLQANHFQIGDPRFMNQKIQSSYQQNMKAPEVSAQGQARDQQQDRGSSFVIGTQATNYKSEFNSHFGPNGGQPAKLNEKTLKDLRSSHFGFYGNQNNYVTTQMAASKNLEGSANNLDPNAMANLRTHHFRLGQEQQGYLSQTHDTHRPLDGQPNKLNEKQARDLRTHHFQLS
ncbi:hypothetical protein pb186bvf_021075 [Paramecium bursaria]